VADKVLEPEVHVFVDDFSLEHCSPGGTVSAIVIVPNSEDAQKPERNKIPRA
jgi:hypothetical protein